MKLLTGILFVFLMSGFVFAQSKEEKENAKLLRTDADFAKMSVEKGAKAAFEFYLAEDALFLVDGGTQIVGRKAIAEYFGRGESTLDWKPAKAEVAESGELGWTWGNSVLKYKDKEGKEQTAYYKYVSIWRKQKNGEWKLTLDIGNSSPAPQ